MQNEKKIAVFGGGCFWCTEALFQNLKGVTRVSSGYAGGITVQPTYKQVHSGNTGHAEVIRIEYDPAIISYTNLLDVFFHVHDPTTLNRQGNDIGEQYRSVIFYSDQSQKEEAEKFIQGLKASKEFTSPIVTTVEPVGNFYEAEDYHQNFYSQNTSYPYCQVIIAPKLAKFRKHFAGLLKS
jgi:peptide-methionine (S)-S-oxide reductase